MRLEESRHRVDHAGPEPRSPARLGRDGDGRQPRHPHLARLRPSRRRGRAHDAAAGGGRRVEGAGRRGQRRQRRHHARRLWTPDDLWQGRCRSREAHAAGSQEHRAQESEGLEDRRSADEAAGYRRTSSNGSQVYAIDVKLPGMLHAAIKACPVFGGKLTSYDEAKISGRPGVRGVVKVNDFDRGRRRRYVVAGQVRARGAPDRLG